MQNQVKPMSHYNTPVTCRLHQVKEDQKCFVKATAWTCWAWLRNIFITGSLFMYLTSTSIHESTISVLAGSSSLTCFTWKPNKALSLCGLRSILYKNNKNTIRSGMLNIHRALNFPQLCTPKNPKNRSNLTGQTPRYIKRSQEQLSVW